jgi:hypothetical protein
MNEVEHFIYKFKFLNPSATEDLFLYGDCYYFSVILKERFKDRVIIKYLMIDNHFVAEIDGRLYDIRGDVTDIVDQKQLIDWVEMKEFDELVYYRIIRDCINF